MRAPPVVPGFDVFHHGGPRGEVVLEVVLVVHFGLHVREKTFRHRVVPINADGSHRLRDRIRGAPFLERAGRILRATIAVKSNSA